MIDKFINCDVRYVNASENILRIEMKDNVSKMNVCIILRDNILLTN